MTFQCKVVVHRKAKLPIPPDRPKQACFWRCVCGKPLKIQVELSLFLRAALPASSSSYYYFSISLTSIRLPKGSFKTQKLPGKI